MEAFLNLEKIGLVGFFRLAKTQAIRIEEGIPFSPYPALQPLQTLVGSGRLEWDFALGDGRR